MVKRYLMMFILISFSHMLLSMDTLPGSPKSFGVHTDLNSFLQLLQRSPQRVAAVTAFLTRTEDLSQAAKKGASVRVVTQPYALKGLVKASSIVQGLPASVHDKLFFVRAKDGHGHGFMGSANLTNNQFNNHETVLSWESPDRTLPGFTRHFAQLLPNSSVFVRQRQNSTAAKLDSLFEVPILSKQVRLKAQELDANFLDDVLAGTDATLPCTPKTRRSGGRNALAARSGGKRARKNKQEDTRPLKRSTSNQLRPDNRGFSCSVGALVSQSHLRSPLSFVEGSPSTRVKRTDSTKRCELISSFEFGDGDLIPWLGHRIKTNQSFNYLLSTMSLNHPEFIAKIQIAAKTGSTFKILVDKKSVDRLKSKKHPLFTLLAMPNVEIRSISGSGRFGSQHSKVFTRKSSDGKTPGLSIVSTANFTKESSNQSNYLLSLPEGAVERESFVAVEDQFLDRWNKAVIVSI